MADNQDRPREDLTEEASPYRIEEFRRRGIVSQSREISGLFVLAASAFTLLLYAPEMGIRISEFMREVFQLDLSVKLDMNGGQLFHQILYKALSVIIAVIFPICLIGFILGVLGSFVQTGGIFSLDPLTPDLERIDPIKGLQKFFSIKHLLDGVRLVFKMVTLILVSYLIIKTKILETSFSVFIGPKAVFSYFGEFGKILLFSLTGVLLIFASIDFGLQKWEFLKNLRLTKQEAKQELKEREGDPQIKARIRSVQKELARRRMMQAVKKADVVVTNPTHIAVALAYDKNNMKAPKVVAKGAEFLAEKIKKIALEARVPLVENVVLARTLYKAVKVGQTVPRVLYQAVAEILAYVYRLKNRRL
ncbi:MAG: flagellar biosynthesis protein FlhB [Deltaproteobacteria bacterium]|nr:flagellar biosynthesis protein FlhB [Deltaproteobacteria bacterium]